MRKLIGKKMKMTQVFKEGRVFGVTPIKLKESGKSSELKAGEMVQVSGISRGHGFTGGVKRWNFKGGPKTHGQKNRLRAPGSIGNTAAQRVLPGRHMAGRMGMDRITYKNILLVEIDAEKGIVLVNGSVPGTIGREVEIRIANNANGAGNNANK